MLEESNENDDGDSYADVPILRHDYDGEYNTYHDDYPEDGAESEIGN